MSDHEEATSYEGKLIVGLTGNIATGKSAIMRMADDAGALAIDADRIVHELMDTDTNIQAAIAVAFGSDVRREDGRINRKELGKIVFDDPQALKDLESMVHPAVRRVVDQRILDADQNIVFIEAIKLLEGELANICHSIWVTRCTPQRQLERLRVCRGLETENAKNRIKKQGPQEEKVAQADVVIDTNGLMKDTELQFNMAWGRLDDPATVEAKARLPLPDPNEPPIPGTSELKEQKEESPQTESAEDTGDLKSKIAALKASTKSTKTETKTEAPDVDDSDVQVRRARPSDIPSILLLIQKATDGRVKMKRAELLMALSERGYFIGQVGTEISTVMGYHMDSQVARIDEIFIYPPEMTTVTAAAVLKEIEKSAFNHMGQIIVAFLANDASSDLTKIFIDAGFTAEEKSTLARNWQSAIDESQPEGTDFVVKIMADIRNV